jgi:hypothetical protein
VNLKLLLNILSSVNGGLITGAALFNPLVGQDMALKIISVLGLCQIIVSAINSNLSTQANTIKEVRAMPGVDKVLVNENANQVLAQIATDPTEPKVGASTPAVREVLKETAKGN